LEEEERRIKKKNPGCAFIFHEDGIYASVGKIRRQWGVYHDFGTKFHKSSSFSQPAERNPATQRSGITTMARNSPLDSYILYYLLFSTYLMYR
jgi:hypothetical protein